MARNPCPSVAESAECITNRIHQVTSPPTSSFLPSSPNQPPTTHPEFRNGRILFHPLRLNFNCYCEDDFQAVIFPPSSLHPPPPPSLFEAITGLSTDGIECCCSVSSPVALNVPVPMEEEDAADAVYLPQRRSPGQRSQDSGFSGYSDSSEGSSNNSPVPKEGSPGAPAPAAPAPSPAPSPASALGVPAGPAAAAGPAAVAPGALTRRSPINLAQAGVLETDLDAPSGGMGCRHVSRVYIGVGDVICQKNIQPVNLSG